MRNIIIEQLTPGGTSRPMGMMKKRIAIKKGMLGKPVMVAASVITGIIALGAGYAESQVAARFAFDGASGRHVVVLDQSFDTPAAVPAPPMAPARAKTHKAAVSRSAVAPARVAIVLASSDDDDDQGGQIRSGISESRMRMLIKQDDVVSQSRIEAMKLVAAATRERFEFSARRGGPPAMVMEREKTDGD